MTLNIRSRKLPRGGLDGFNSSLRQIKDVFGIKWLESHGDHPLMKLWIRTDAFASIQLHQFGYSLRKIKYLNPKWFDDAIDKIIKNNTGERRGVVLEVLVASQLHSPPDRVVELPHPNNPGYDIKVKHSNNSVIYYQVKNNNWSNQYYIMKEKARSVEEILEANLGSEALQVIIKINIEPEERDWHSLKDQLPTLLRDTSPEEDAERNIEGRWIIRIRKLHAPGNRLHPTKKTYVMQLITPIPQTEKNNIAGDIDEACDVLEKKKEQDTETSINIALICVPLDAPFALCSEWVNDFYFVDHPKARVSGVLLYKPGVVTDIDNETDIFSHAYHLVIKKEKEDWIKALSTLDIAVGRGSFSVEGINNLDNFNQLYEGDTRDDYKGFHIYQSGHINYLIIGLGSIKIHSYFGIQERVFYIDSDRQEKEATTDLSQDLDLVLLR